MNDYNLEGIYPILDYLRGLNQTNMNSNNYYTNGQAPASQELFDGSQKMTQTQPSLSTISSASLPPGQRVPISSLYGANSMDVAPGSAPQWIIHNALTEALRQNVPQQPNTLTAEYTNPQYSCLQVTLHTQPGIHEEALSTLLITLNKLNFKGLVATFSMNRSEPHANSGVYKPPIFVSASDA
jgi:hypothetical protein